MTARRSAACKCRRRRERACVCMFAATLHETRARTRRSLVAHSPCTSTIKTFLQHGKQAKSDSNSNFRRRIANSGQRGRSRLVNAAQLTAAANRQRLLGDSKQQRSRQAANVGESKRQDRRRRASTSHNTKRKLHTRWPTVVVAAATKFQPSTSTPTDSVLTDRAARSPRSCSPSTDVGEMSTHCTRPIG